MRPRPWLKHYDYWVPAELTCPGRPLSEILDTTAFEIPDRPATAFLGAELTFRDIKTRSDRFAAALARRGVTKGDRVGIMLPNCPQYIIAAFAVLRLGAVVVNVNPTYTAPELTTIVSDSGLRVLLTLDRLAPLALGLASQLEIDLVIVTSLAEYPAQAAPPARIDGTASLADLIEEGAGAEMPRVAITADDLAVLQYTGGTTGTPKGAMLTHGNIFANVVQSETWYYRTYERGKARYLLVIPYFHIYAFTVGMMCGTWIGALQILLPKYDVEQVLAAIRDYQPTYFPAVPTIYVSLLAHPRVTEFGLEHGRPLQLRRRTLSCSPHGTVRAADRAAAESGIRSVGNVSGDARDAAPRQAQARDHRPADAGHGHQGGRRRHRRARAAARATPASCASPDRR